MSILCYLNLISFIFLNLFIRGFVYIQILKINLMNSDNYKTEIHNMIENGKDPKDMVI